MIQKCISGILCFLVLGHLSVHPANAQIWNAVSRKANLAVITGYLRTYSTQYPRAEVWTLKPFKRRSILELGQAWETSPAISASGKLVAFGLTDSTIEIFETRTGKLWKKLGQPQYNEQDGQYLFQIYTISFAPNGKTIATGNRKGLFVWSLRDGKLLFSRKVPTVGKLENWGTHRILFSPDSRSIVVSTNSGWRHMLYKFDVKRKQFGVQYRTYSEDGGPLVVEFSPNGRRLLVSSDWDTNWNDSKGSFDQICVFESNSGRALWRWNNRAIKSEQHDTANYLTLSAWSNDGKRVAIGNEHELQIHDARTGKLLLKRALAKSEYATDPPTFQQQKRFHPQLNIH